MRKQQTYMKISHLYLNNQLISENRFLINNNLDEKVILKTFGMISSFIDIKSGETKADCSYTALRIEKIIDY